jgi:hypothetical protein
MHLIDAMDPFLDSTKLVLPMRGSPLEMYHAKMCHVQFAKQQKCAKTL